MYWSSLLSYSYCSPTNNEQSLLSYGSPMDIFKSNFPIPGPSANIVKVYFPIPDPPMNNIKVYFPIPSPLTNIV